MRHRTPEQVSLVQFQSVVPLTVMIGTVDSSAVQFGHRFAWCSSLWFILRENIGGPDG